jgi:hypothetical protein
MNYKKMVGLSMSDKGYPVFNNKGINHYILLKKKLLKRKPSNWKVFLYE